MEEEGDSKSSFVTSLDRVEKKNDVECKIKWTQEEVSKNVLLV